MKTILIVDDEFGLAEVLAATLTDVGFRALTAANGARGLKVMAEHRPDVVLLDYMMPMLDGPGTMSAMRADARLADVPVIMMSSLTESVVRVRCDGYVAFLRKPFEFETMLAAVERTLGHRHDR